MKRKKITRSTALLMAAGMATVSVMSAPGVTVNAQQTMGKAPFINSWLVSGPFAEPVADMIYECEDGMPLERPEDGNWARIATVGVSSTWQTSYSDYPGNSPSQGHRAENAVDGDKSTVWLSQMHDTENPNGSTWPKWDPKPTYKMEWKKPIKVKMVQFYNRYSASWGEQDISRLDRVDVILKDKNGEILAKKTVEGRDAIDYKGETPGVADFGEAVSGVSAIDLEIIHNGEKTYHNVGLGFSEVEVFDGEPIGKPEDPDCNINLAPKAKITASSCYPNNPLENLVDGSTRKQWVTLDGGQDKEPWVQLTWDEPVTFNEVSLAQWGDGRHVNQYYDLTFTYADGTVSDPVRVESTDSSPSKPTVYAFDHYLKNVKSVKVEVDKGRTPYPGITGISEMEVYKRSLDTPDDRPSDGNWAPKAVAEANSEFSAGYAAARAIDGDTNTDWASKGSDGKDPKVLTLTWDYDVPVKQIEALSRFADPGVDDVKNVECLLYDAQDNLITSGQMTDPTGDTAGVVEFDKVQEKVRKIEMRLTGTGNMGFKEVWIYDGFEEELPPEQGDAEAQIIPVIGENFGTEGTEQNEWEYFDDRLWNRTYDDYQDLNGYYTVKKGIDTKEKYVYAHTYVYSPKRQKAQVRVGASGSYRVYFNDRLLANESVPAEVQKDMSKLDVVLEKGWNKVLIQIEHTYTEDCNANGVPVAADYDVSYMGFYARVTNSRGEMPEGIIYSTTGGEAEELQIVNQALSADDVDLENGMGLPENTMPAGYKEWPYVWNKSTTSNQYGVSASAFQFMAAGGNPEYKWEIVDGKLPDNLELNEDGTIADGLVNGKPDLNSDKGIIPASCKEGDYTFTVQVTDADGKTAEKEFTITVKERPNKWFEEGRVGALSHCITIPTWSVDPNFSADLWAERAKRQGHSLVSIEAGQQHYYWPSKFDDPNGRNKWYLGEDGKVPDGLKPFEEAVKRYGMKFGLYYPGRGTDMDVQDISDLIKRYDPDYIYYDGPQFGRNQNFDVTYSNIRNYSDEIIINSNAWGEEYGDPDLGTHESSGIYANVGQNHFVKKVVFEPWKSVHTKNNYTPYYAKRDDYRQVTKEMIMNAGRGYADNNDQMPLMSRGVNWDKPEDVATRYPKSIQEFIDVREGLASWFAPEGLPERHESTTGTTPYFLSGYGNYQDDGKGNYDYFAHPSTANTPGWGYAMARDNQIYLHIIKGPDSKKGFDAISNRTLEVGPINGKVEKVTWLNENQPVQKFEQNGDRLTIDLSNVTEDPIDTIIKITTDSKERKYKLTNLYLEGEQLASDSLQIKTEGQMTYPALKAELEKITYKSSDTEIAAVDESGKVTPGGKNGTAVITVAGTYEGVTLENTMHVTAKDGMIYVGDKMIGAVLKVNGKESYGEMSAYDQAELDIGGRSEDGGNIGLNAAKITWHTGTVDLKGGDNYTPVKIEENNVLSVEKGKLTASPVEKQTRAVVWADVELDGQKFTTNRVFLDVLPYENMAKKAEITASENEDQIANLTDGKAIDGIHTDESKWSGSADGDSWIGFRFDKKQNVSGLNINFNSLDQNYYHTPKNFEIQVSEDGNEWRTVSTQNGPTGGAYFGFYNTYAVNAETQYLRLLFHSNGMPVDILEVSVNGVMKEIADYTKVNEAKAKAEALLEKQYTPESWAVLQTVLGNVVEDLDKAEQVRVNEMADAIYNAIEALVWNKDAAEKGKYTVAVKGGKFAGTDENTGDYAYNTKITVVAETSEEGKVFAGWKVNGKVVSTETEYTFYVSNDMTLEALYEVSEKMAETLLTNVITTKRPDGKYDVQFVGQLVVPEGYTLKNAGLVWSSKEGTDLVLEGGLKPTYITKISNTNQFSVTIKGVPEGKFLRGKLFATIVSDNTEETIYSVEKKAMTETAQ